MSFYGKVFVVEKEENFEDFIKTLELPEENMRRLLQYKPSQKIERNGDDYTFTISKTQGEKVYKFKSGEEFADTVRELKVKITITVDENKVTQIVKFENGVTLSAKKEYNDNSFTEEITHSKWNGVARRLFKAQ